MPEPNTDRGAKAEKLKCGDAEIGMRGEHGLGFSFQRFSVSAFQRFSISDLSPLWGVYHLAASGSTSWHGFAQVIVDLMPLEERKCRKVEAIRTEEYPLPAQRPACSVLGCDKLRRVFGLGLPDWEEQLKLASGVAA